MISRFTALRLLIRCGETMNGYVEAGYGVVLVGLGGYSAWLTRRSAKMKRVLIPIRVLAEKESKPKEG